MSKLIDLKGQVFGKLTVISRAENNKANKAQWLCECECGNKKIIVGTQLRNGHTKSCGCLQKEKASENMVKIQKIGAQTRLIDLTGQTFGKLTVIRRDNINTSQNKPKWICQCECGKIISVSGYCLKSNQTKSCGCLGISEGEYIIKKILQENNIPFLQEVKFSDLKDKTFLRYDFGILDSHNKIIKLIEFDGKQHFDKSSIWYSEELVKRDKIKNEYAVEHNIPLLRIKYTDKENINLEMLLEGL